ncbi:pro-sigmaK processing inhibitor BofA family protein [Rossellomorea sp. BNER]|uniref:pro-sigmaK processing inhibitor BofA family protein n=1 Tax=Rossellomorea sp. BNER TaxID=2962031 RepID=UPI003AF2B1D6|nr:pro-sigmaK processing inhibitor BofA family protein [Rossellomorea sp. BNER]
MSPIVVIGIISSLIVFLLVAGTPFKPVRIVGQVLMKVMIGALFLFFLNAFGGQFGIHVPINLATSSISGILGIPGVIGLTVIQTYILV